MLPNIKICKNGWSNFPKKLRIVALKFLALTRFLSPRIRIDFLILILILIDFQIFAVVSYGIGGPL